MWVWLCSFSPHCLRSHDLPWGRDQWPKVCAQLHRLGAPGNWKEQALSMESKGNQALIHGMLQIEPGSEWQGSLTPWPIEARIQHEFYGSPADAYTVKICNVFHFDQPTEVFTTAHGGQEKLISLRASSMVFKPTAMERLLNQKGTCKCSYRHDKNMPCTALHGSCAQIPDIFAEEGKAAAVFLHSWSPGTCAGNMMALQAG